MDKAEFNKKIFQEFDMNELQQINLKIYFNPDHIEYYEQYHCENYDWCFDYLIKHRNLLKND